MTATLKEEVYLTPEQYLALEETSELRHEFIGGCVELRPQASRVHTFISDNILTGLDSQLPDGPCVVLSSQMRLRIVRSGLTYFYYPDVTVECSEGTLDMVDEPIVIFEVVAPETARTDFGEKMLNYLDLPTMKIYVLVEQARTRLTVHRRGEEGAWMKEVLTDLEATLSLPEIGCSLPLRAIYRRTKLAAQE